MVVTIVHYCGRQPCNVDCIGPGSYVPLSEGGEMYGRGGGGGGGAGGPALTGALSSAALSKSSSADYSTYQQYPPAYQQDQVHAQQYLTQHAE